MNVYAAAAISDNMTNKAPARQVPRMRPIFASCGLAAAQLKPWFPCHAMYA